MSGRTRSDSRARTRCRNKQRIARCHAVTGADERVRRLAEPLLHEHARCVWRQRLWTQHRRVGFQHQLGEAPLAIAVLAGPRGHGEDDRETLEPLRQVGQVTQRCTVAPLNVIDREQQRPVGCEVRRQPEQFMEDGERAVSPLVPDHEVVEHTTCARRRSAEQRAAVGRTR